MMITATPNSKSAHEAKLKSIKLSGFRSIKELDLELGEVTVLIGANGSGKSNLLAFFEMMRYVVSERLQFYVGRNGGASSVLRYGPECTNQIGVELNLDEGDKSNTYQLTLAFAKPDGLVFSGESWRFWHAIGGEFIGDLGSGHLESKIVHLRLEHSMGTRSGDFPDGHVSQAVETMLQVARTFESYEVSRAHISQVIESTLHDFSTYHFNETSEVDGIRVSQDLNRNQHLVSNASNLAAFLYMLRETYSHYFNRIVSTIRFAVPYFNNFILEPDRLSENPRILLRWQDKRLDYEFGPHQLSDGSLRAIALITLLLQPKELLPSIILLDEPELGLHPSAVGLIGSLIKAISADRQVIVATQSPRLLAEFVPEDVVVVEREEDKTGAGQSTFKRLTRAELGDWLSEYDLGTLYEMNVTGGGPQ